MLFNPARGRRNVPLELNILLLPLDIDGPGGSGRRPHRGQLPDVDLSRLEPDPAYVPLLGRLANLLRALAAGLDRLSGASQRRLGESA